MQDRAERIVQLRSGQKVYRYAVRFPVSERGPHAFSGGAWGRAIAVSKTRHHLNLQNVIFDEER
jgi:hypothetical protein